MTPVLHVARTEVVEHRRQPLMIGILALNYILWSTSLLFAVVVLGQAAEQPELIAILARQGAGLGICDGESALDALLKLLTSTHGALLFTNLPLFVAIMSGYSVLHDRASGAMPFLMLAPLSRYQLLLGKLLGAMAIPVLLHLVFVGGISMLVGGFEVMSPFSSRFGASPAWWLAYLFGAPAAGFFVGALGTVISGLSRDVRTSMQFTSFSIGLLSLVFGFALFDGIAYGAAAQAGFAVATSLGGLIVLFVGSRIISRDISN